MAADGRAELGRYVHKARVLRRQDQPEFARSVGLGVRTLGKIERGESVSYNDKTREIIEWELGWEDGSVEAVLRGGQPRRKVDPLLDRLLEAWRQLPMPARRLLVSSAESALRES